MRKVLIGVSGGIAAYKAAAAVSGLVQAGLDVQVIMTPNAIRFVTPLTFAALTRKKVITSLFPDNPGNDRESLYPHLYPATEADLFAVIPATANLLAKLAGGLGDEPVSTAALSLKPDCLRFICPAMNSQMWRQPVVQDNLKRLHEYSWRSIGPESGRMACGTDGAGRMSEPETIVQTLLAALGIS